MIACTWLILRLKMEDVVPHEERKRLEREKENDSNVKRLKMRT